LIFISQNILIVLVKNYNTISSSHKGSIYSSPSKEMCCRLWSWEFSYSCCLFLATSWVTVHLSHNPARNLRIDKTRPVCAAVCEITFMNEPSQTCSPVVWCSQWECAAVLSSAGSCCKVLPCALYHYNSTHIKHWCQIDVNRF